MVEDIRSSFTVFKFSLVLDEDSEGSFDGGDGLIGFSESGSVGDDGVSEVLLGGGEEFFVEFDLNEEVVSLGFLGDLVNLSLSFIGFSLSLFGLLLRSEGVDFSDEELVVFSRSFFTLSVVSVGFLDGTLDLFELGNNGGELFLVELGRELDESLDGVALGDSAQGTFDFLLGDLEERVSTGLEGLKLGDDLGEGFKGVLVTDLAGSVSVDVVVTGLVDEDFSVVEVLDFNLEVSDLGGELGEDFGETSNFVVSSFQVGSFVGKVVVDLFNESFEVGLLGHVFSVQGRSLVLDVLEGFFNQLDDFIDSATGGKVEFDSGHDLLGDLGLLADEAHSFDSDRSLHGLSSLSERDGSDCVAADQSQ